METVTIMNVPPFAVRPSARCCRLPRQRRGLAPLELVLWMPPLLMVMALMVIIGNAGAWKLRTVSTARHEVWKARWPRSGALQPAGLYWPPGAPSGVQWSENLQPLDDDRLRHPVARGPLPGQFRVDEQLLDFSRGARHGEAHLVRSYPMLASMGRYDFQVEHPLLTDPWTFRQTRLGSNVSRRIPAIYELPKAPPAYSQAFADAAMAIITFARRADLEPLDRDADIIAVYGSPRDFHPQLQNFCTLERDEVQRLVDRLIQRIRGTCEGEEAQGPRLAGVPRTMASFFRQLERDRDNEAMAQMYEDFLNWLATQDCS